MPRMLAEDMNSHALPTGSFGFSAVKVEKLGATQYTLVTIVLDESGSVEGFQNEMENAIWSAVGACQRSPQAENVLLRVVAFSTTLREIHGFRPLAGLSRADYDGSVTPTAATALHEAIIAAYDATAEYAKQLAAQDYEANAVLFFVTDGLNNRPPEKPASVREGHRRAAKTEALGTITSVLVGVNDQATETHEGQVQKIGDVLAKLQREAGMTQYVGLPDASLKTLAKLAQFVSKSISSASKALTTGGGNSVPQPVTF